MRLNIWEFFQRTCVVFIYHSMCNNEAQADRLDTWYRRVSLFVYACNSKFIIVSLSPHTGKYTLFLHRRRCCCCCYCHFAIASDHRYPCLSLTIKTISQPTAPHSCTHESVDWAHDNKMRIRTFKFAAWPKKSLSFTRTFTLTSRHFIKFINTWIKY